MFFQVLPASPSRLWTLKVTPFRFQHRTLLVHRGQKVAAFTLTRTTLMNWPQCTVWPPAPVTQVRLTLKSIIAGQLLIVYIRPILELVFVLLLRAFAHSGETLCSLRVFFLLLQSLSCTSASISGSRATSAPYSWVISCRGRCATRFVTWSWSRGSCQTLCAWGFPARLLWLRRRVLKVSMSTLAVYGRQEEKYEKFSLLSSGGPYILYLAH